jgi:hypothetical protein
VQSCPNESNIDHGPLGDLVGVYLTLWIKKTMAIVCFL